MECSRVQSLISEYSVGLVEGRQKSLIEEHLASCPECMAELKKLERVMLLVDGLDLREPPVGLWNGVYNRITAPEAEPERVRTWQQIRDMVRRRTRIWSAGVAAAALAVMMLLTHAHNPGVDSTYAASEYVQGHAIYASQDVLADQTSLQSVAALADREQAGG